MLYGLLLLIGLLLFLIGLFRLLFRVSIGCALLDLMRLSLLGSRLVVCALLLIVGMSGSRAIVLLKGGNLLVGLSKLLLQSLVVLG